VVVGFLFSSLYKTKLMTRTFFPALLGCCIIAAAVQAQPAAKVQDFKKQALADIERNRATYNQVALQVWSYAEVGYKEVKSSSLLQETLKQQGFAVEAGVAGIPTAFVAVFGNGKPVIGILAEFDALPGMSQDSVPVKQPVNGRDAGHACGHHLFGTASIAAAIALKATMEKNHLAGTIKVFGTPAEEGGSGKVYMVRAGLFNGVDAVLHWHPGDKNAVLYGSSLANMSAKFRFYGVAAHAAASPEKGRSALDGVEAMDYMVNMLREHISSDTRIHYIITNGGKAPNVVPDFAEAYYYVRNPARDKVKDIFGRVVKAAEGAALGTGTRMEYEVTGGVYDLLINKTLAASMQQNLESVGGITYTPTETAFAQKIGSSFSYTPPAIATAATVTPLETSHDMGGSTDVADVSWTVPTVGLSTATWVPGTPAHSWQAVACGGTTIGLKGMLVAAKTMALTGIDLLTNKTLLEKATAEFNQLRGPGFTYEALLGNRPPALHYRD
jgi:aminobenzoyl-glutamate utilization protein B